MGRYIRIELCFDGENQECGIFQALDETGITEEQYFTYADYFEKELFSPTVEPPCWFFFTVEGIKKFLPVIKDILKTIEPHGWDFDLMFMETDMTPTYEDELQAAWHYDGDNTLPIMTRNVSDTNEMETIINDFIEKGGFNNMDGWKVGVAYERYGYIHVSKEEASTEEEAFNVAEKKAEAMTTEELEAITEPLLSETLEIDREGVLGR